MLPHQSSIKVSFRYIIYKLYTKWAHDTDDRQDVNLVWGAYMMMFRSSCSTFSLFLRWCSLAACIQVKRMDTWGFFVKETHAELNVVVPNDWFKRENFWCEKNWEIWMDWQEKEKQKKKKAKNMKKKLNGGLGDPAHSNLFFHFRQKI